MKTLLILLFTFTITGTAFSQDLNKYIPKGSEIHSITYTNFIRGEWLVHKIHDTNKYEIVIKSTIVDPKRLKKAVHEALNAYYNMRKLNDTTKPVHI